MKKVKDITVKDITVLQPEEEELQLVSAELFYKTALSPLFWPQVF